MVFTASLDKYVKIFDLDGYERGCLQQGYMLKKDYQWRFPMKDFDENLGNRQQEMQTMLKAERNEPGKDKRRERVEANLRQANSTTGGMMSRTGASIMSPTPNPAMFSTMPQSPERQSMPSMAMSAGKSSFKSRNQNAITVANVLNKGYQ